ncbi:MAG: hypothetical protein U0797_22050 [Gemmataceae bacterium]
MNTPRSARKIRIYMVQPKFPPSYWGMEHFIKLTPFQAVFPPLGLLTLAALTPPDIDVELVDENAGEEVDFATDAELICITGYVIQMKRVFEIADEFRALGKTVVLGGPMANLLPEECRPHCDVLFEGEAEYTWPRFAREYAEGRHADHYVEHEKIHLPDSPPPRLDVLSALRQGSCSVRGAARSPASSATSSSCTAARCASSPSSRSSPRSRPGTRKA